LFVQAWNAHAKANGWRGVESMNSKRARSFKARFKDKYFRDNWVAALSRMDGNPFFSGQNERHWKATVDFFLRPNSVPKILEGNYDRAPAKARRGEVDYSNGWDGGEA